MRRPLPELRAEAHRYSVLARRQYFMRRDHREARRYARLAAATMMIAQIEVARLAVAMRVPAVRALRAVR
jgi:hypothetical protein